MPEVLTKPRKGCVVYCRSHHHLVEDVQPPEDSGDTVVRLACLDDDANGQITDVFWEREVDARGLGQSTWETIGQRGFDDPRVFSSYLRTLQWNCVTATDPGLFQAPAPLRAGIDVKPSNWSRCARPCGCCGWHCSLPTTSAWARRLKPG